MRRPVALLLPLLLVTAACTRRPAEEKAIEVGLVPNRLLFQFEEQEVREVELSQSAPSAPRHWSASVKRQSPAPTGPTTARWEIDSSPGGDPLIDRRADDGYVNHLLDTLKTLRVAESVSNQDLDRHGLNPPQYSLRLHTADGKAHEIRVGDTASDEGVRYAVLPEYGDQIITVQGAALNMLEHLSQFETLRGRKLFPFPSDEIDRMEMFRPGHSAFYAERRGDNWIDRRKKPVSIDVDELLESLVHLRVKAFVDSADQNHRLFSRIRAQPLYWAVLTNRHDQRSEIRVRLIDGRLYATLTDRPEAVFELYPESARLFATLKR